jgi:hypothetical protein
VRTAIAAVSSSLQAKGNALPVAPGGEVFLSVKNSPVHAIAEAHGFVERNPVVPRKRRRPVEEPTHSFTARVSVRSANAFIEWCERERMSYREGFDRLVSLIDRA